MDAKKEEKEKALPPISETLVTINPPKPRCKPGFHLFNINNVCCLCGIDFK